MNNKVFNTGETSEELKQKYNPEGSTLRDVQYRLLEMLIYFDEVCKNAGVDYRIDSGNVIGAIRHGGFIPWDDDVDVVVDKKDYSRLCDYLLKHPHPQYVLQCDQTDKDFCSFWNVLRDTKSEYIQDSAMHNCRKYKGMQIDIFPYEAGTIPFLYKFTALISIVNDRYIIKHSLMLRRIIYRFQKHILHPLFSFLSTLFGDRNIYSHNYGCGFTCRISKDVLLPHKDIVFEGYTFPGPAKPEEFCKVLYKNFMDLPPIEKRNNHQASYRIWK